MVGHGRDEEHGRGRGGEQRHQEHGALEACGGLEAVLERDGQQEAEQDLYAGHRDAHLVEHLQQFAVEALVFALLGALVCRGVAHHRVVTRK